MKQGIIQNREGKREKVISEILLPKIQKTAGSFCFRLIYPLEVSMINKSGKIFFLFILFSGLLSACSPDREGSSIGLETETPTGTAISLDLLDETPTSTGTPIIVMSTAAAEPEVVNCGLIAFVLYAEGTSDIYSVCPDGSHLSRLTEGPAWESYPAWSPNGERIAYASTLNAQDSQIYLMDADGKNVKQLTEDLINDRPLWLPGGEQMAFRTTDGDGLWWWRILDLESGEIKDYSQPSYDFFWQTPAFSPDGTQVAVMSLTEQAARNDGSSQIHLLNAEGDFERAITWDTWANVSPVWSPDGEQIAFLSERDGTYNSFALYVMDTHGDNLKKLSDAVFSESSILSWSPDGTRIAVDKLFMSDGGILLFDLEGNEPQPLLDLPSGQQAVMPSWAH